MRKKTNRNPLDLLPEKLNLSGKKPSISSEGFERVAKKVCSEDVRKIKERLTKKIKRVDD